MQTTSACTCQLHMSSPHDGAHNSSKKIMDFKVELCKGGQKTSVSNELKNCLTILCLCSCHHLQKTKGPLPLVSFFASLGDDNIGVKLLENAKGR